MSATPTKKFPTGSLAFSRSHQTLVWVGGWDESGATLTRAIHPVPLEGRVKEEDLMTVKEFEDWAPTQPWYRPHPEVPADVLAICGDIGKLLARFRA